MGNEDLTHLVTDMTKKKGKSMTGLVDLASLALAPASVPLALVLMVGAYAREAHENNRRLSSAPMPDKWLQQISESEEVTKEGLAHLAKCLDKKGYVSIKDAQHWVNIEEQAAKRREKEEERRVFLKDKGAHSLMNRAKRECPSMFNIDIGRTMDRIQKYGRGLMDSIDRPK